MSAKRVLISVDERLLARIDRAATGKGATRSAYLADLAARDLEIGPGSDAGVAAALRSIDALFAGAPPFDPVEAMRTVRARP